MSSFDDLLKIIGEAPAEHLSSKTAQRLASFVGASDEILRTELFDIVQEIQDGEETASEFALNVLLIIQEQLEPPSVSV